MANSAVRWLRVLTVAALSVVPVKKPAWVKLPASRRTKRTRAGTPGATVLEIEDDAVGESVRDVVRVGVLARAIVRVSEGLTDIVREAVVVNERDEESE